MLRILTWTCLGPWVKLLDIFWIHQYYRTKEDLLRDGIPSKVEDMQKEIAERPNILKPIFQTKWVQSLARSGRIVSEQSIKLRDFREHRYGKWSERVPEVDTSRFPSVPNAASYAQPYASPFDDPHEGDFKDLPPDAQNWCYIPGQKLEGDMIPHPIVRAVNPSHRMMRTSVDFKQQ